MPHLDVTGRAYTKVGTALTTYAGSLAGVQDRMSPLRVQAPGLWEALQQAKLRVSNARSADLRHRAQVEAEAVTTTVPLTRLRSAAPVGHQVRLRW